MGLTMSCVIRSTTTHRKGLLMLDSSEPLVFISSEQALLYLEKNTGIKNAVVFPVTDFYDDKIPPNIAVASTGDVLSQNVLEHLKKTQTRYDPAIMALVGR